MELVRYLEILSPIGEGPKDNLCDVRNEQQYFFYGIATSMDRLWELHDYILANDKPDFTFAKLIGELRGIIRRVTGRDMFPIYSPYPQSLYGTSEFSACWVFPIFVCRKLNHNTIDEKHAGKISRRFARYFARIPWTPPPPTWFYGGHDYGQCLKNGNFKQAARIIQHEVEHEAAKRAGVLAEFESKYPANKIEIDSDAVHDMTILLMNMSRADIMEWVEQWVEQGAE